MNLECYFALGTYRRTKCTINIDMTLNLHTALPIFIISTPRSGSNIFLELVKRDFPYLKTFSEPDTSTSIMDGLNNAIVNNKQFITKIHILHLMRKCSNEMLQYPLATKDFLLSNNTFKVAIKRKDVISQIVSRYIAVSRNTWYYDKITTNVVDAANVNIEVMQNCVDVTKEHLTLLDKVQVDAEFYYEDIMDDYGGNIESSYNFKSPHPKNYDLLIGVASDLFFRSNVLK